MRWLVVLLLSSAVHLLPGGASAVSISLTPDQPSVSVGGSVTLTLEVSALGGAAVGTFDLNVSYDATRFALNSVSFAGALGDVGLGEQLVDVVNSVGNVNVASVSLLDPGELAALQGDPVVLVSFVFDAAAPGSGAFGFGALLLGDAFGAPLAIGTQTGATVDVPEPALALLLALGAVALVRRGRS